jgi:DNA-binding NtrC family response regulator
MNRSLFLLDDDKAVLGTLRDALAELSPDIRTCANPMEALGEIRSHPPSVVITDLKMPGLGGMEVLKRIHEFRPGLPVIMITGHGGVEEAVEAMRNGAYDFIRKPFSLAEIEVTVKRALEKAALLEENLRLKERLRKTRIPEFAEGKSAAFRELLDAALLGANSEATILILGESGTGKEILAHYVAAHSRRAMQPFVAVNCAAIPANLIESELFGHKRGAFTGAHQDRKGKFQEANGGTIFLDEIGELPLVLQGALLRVLQEGEVAPLGGQAQKVDVRVIAATNKPLRKMAAEGLFREDLYYRLNVLALQIPPLRGRMDDFPAYVSFFIEKYCRKNRREPVFVDSEAMKILERHSWPGNLRELENVIERAVILTPGNTVTPKVLPPELTETEGTESPFKFRRGMTLDEIEMKIIREVLRFNDGDRARSAEELGIGERTLYRKLQEMQRENLTERVDS